MALLSGMKTKSMLDVSKIIRKLLQVQYTINLEFISEVQNFQVKEISKNKKLKNSNWVGDA